MSGWPTTFGPPPTEFTCITGALEAGAPARMVVISAGATSSGRKTADGYDIPTRRVVTWIVLGPGDLQQTTDRSADGGEVTTQRCTGLSSAPGGSPPVGTGCTTD